MTSPARRQRTSGRVERQAYLTRTPPAEVRRTHPPDGRADRVHRGRRAQHGHADVDQQLAQTVLQVLKGHISDGEWADLKARMPTSLSAVLR